MANVQDLPMINAVNKKEPKKVKIMQFGEGNFLRAFVDWIINEMNKANVYDGGVVVVQPMSFGRCKELAEADGLYTLYLQGLQDGQAVRSHEVIKCLQDFINPFEQYDKYLELLDEIKRVEEDDTLYGNAYPRRKVINLRTKEIFNTVNGAGKSIGVGGSVIYDRCHKHQGWMYLDEYEKIEDKNSIVIEEPKWKPVSVYCLETNTVYESIADAVRQTGVKLHTIKRQCDGFVTRNNTYHFCYTENIN